jgi:hypothetical protein
MTLIPLGRGAPASAAEVGTKCSEQQSDTTTNTPTPVATPATGALILKRISGGGPLPRDHAALASDLLPHGNGILNSWERGFLTSLRRFNELSRNQRRVLRQICRKIYAARIGQ